VFVGSGAPKGKELRLPGREAAAANVHIGIAWLESVAFGHIEKIGERVLIIGVGNTAMDCCRTSLRLGARSVKVMARKPRGFFKASAWELEDAEEESVEIVVNYSPKAFVAAGGKLTGMMFDKMEYDIDAQGRITGERIVAEEFVPADDVILAIGQENAFPWIERDLQHRVRQVGCAGGRHHDLPVDPTRRVSSAGTRRSVRRTSSGPWSTDTRRPFRCTATARASR
jgi:formate dehydrogenase beta subunit